MVLKLDILLLKNILQLRQLKKKNRRLIGVGSGFKTKKDRSRESAKLINWGFNNFDLIEITKKNKELTELDVWLGYKNKVKTYINQDVYKTIPKARKKYIKALIEYEGPIEAPIKKDDILGKMKIFYKDELLKEYEVLAFEDIKKVNILSRVIKSINYLIWGDV